MLAFNRFKSGGFALQTYSSERGKGVGAMRNPGMSCGMWR